jgi:hypothetical protein
MNILRFERKATRNIEGLGLSLEGLSTQVILRFENE